MKDKHHFQQTTGGEQFEFFVMHSIQYGSYVHAMCRERCHEFFGPGQILVQPDRNMLPVLVL